MSSSLFRIFPGELNECVPILNSLGPDVKPSNTNQLLQEAKSDSSKGRQEGKKERRREEDGREEGGT